MGSLIEAIKVSDPDEIYNLAAASFVSSTFEQFVKIMLDEDIKRWKMFLDGKFFPWDAPLYPDESKIITRSGFGMVLNITDIGK